MIGQTVSHFEILERIGQGGMGVVYKARDLRLDRLVALKFLPSHLGGDVDVERRFLREARTASALDHTNICTIYEIGETEDGRTFIAMAYCDGETLGQRIARGPLPVEEVIRIAAQVAHGLAEAHARGIVHRDIKPGNIALTRDGAVKILDFGLATLPGSTRITQTDSTSGTVSYMSPEQVRGDPVDPRTDIWSWGVVTYEMLTGQLPFRGDRAQAVIYSILNDDPKAMTGILPAAQRLQSIVSRALAKDPSLRYQSAEELLSELGATAPSESPTLTMRAVPPKEGGAGQTSRRRRSGLVLAAVAIALLAVWAARRFRPPSVKPTAPPSSTTVAVFPFRYRGSDQYRYLSDGMVDLLSAKLDNAGALRTIDPRAIAGLAAGESALDPERGRLAALRLRAQHFVLGSIVEIGGKVQIDATLYSAEGRLEPTVQTNAAGEVAKAFDLVDELAIGLLAELGAGDSFLDPVRNDPAFQRILGEARAKHEAFKTRFFPKAT